MAVTEGRPSKYRPEYCDQLIAHMSQGFSYESFSGTIGTHRDTLYEWEKVYPEFSDAKKQGVEMSSIRWERTLMNHADGDIKTGTAAVIFALKCRFGWREPEHTLPDINLTLKYNLDDTDPDGV